MDFIYYEFIHSLQVFESLAAKAFQVFFEFKKKAVTGVGSANDKELMLRGPKATQAEDKPETARMASRPS